MLTALIMAGGSGERFWPLSTKEKPKQLLNLVSEKTMIRETVDRILPIIPSENIFIGTNAVQAEGIKKELPDIPVGNIIIEPSFKDTAAAIGYGAIIIDNKYPDATMVVLASDHLIKYEENFRETILKAADEANNGSIVTLGIKPTKPETGYGYIETAENEIGKATPIIQFCEKPDLDTAKYYLGTSRFLWNSGMFIFNTNTILEEIKKHANNHYKTLIGIKNKLNGETGIRLSKLVEKNFERFEKISIDYAVMENAENIKVIPVDFGWNDIGSYPALEDVLESDDYGNISRNVTHIMLDSINNIVLGTGKRIVATVGLSDTVVVETDNAILVCKKSEAQHIKKILKQLA